MDDIPYEILGDCPADSNTCFALRHAEEHLREALLLVTEVRDTEMPRYERSELANTVRP
jgi:hypothetical protein